MKQFMFFQKNEDAFERIFDEAERLEAELERQRDAEFERMMTKNSAKNQEAKNNDW